MVGWTDLKKNADPDKTFPHPSMKGGLQLWGGGVAGKSELSNRLLQLRECLYNKSGCAFEVSN